MIMFSWLATSTITAEAGGDTLSTIYRRLYFDGAETERYTAAAEVTAHSVERASDVADHIRAGLRKITLDVGFVSDPVAAREELETLRKTGQVLTITTSIGEYPDMVVVGISETRTTTTGDSFFCQIEAQEIRRVDAEEIEAPAPQVERARPQTNRGRQQTTETPTAQPTSTAATDRSASLLERAREGAAALLAGAR